MKAPSFPMEVKKPTGNAVVTIYEREYWKETKEGKTRYLEYKLAYRETTGSRKFETSADFLALRNRADEVLDDLNEGRAPDDGGALKIGQRNDYLQSVGKLEACEVFKASKQTPTLLTAVEHYVRAVEILGADLVIAAAQEYAKRHMEEPEPLDLGKAVVEFLEQKEKQNRSDRHRETLKSHLERFANFAKVDIATVTAADIERFLNGLRAGDPPRPVGARTRDNYLNSIITLFKWAKVKRYVPADFDEHTRIARYDGSEDGPIEIYRPSEMGALLRKADAKLVPFLAIGGFAGLRSSEVLRLDWSDVKFDNGSSCIVVQKGKVKMRGKSRRIVPMSENLRAWLEPHAEKSGPVWPYSKPYLYEMLRELAPVAEALLQESDPKAKLEWKSNALRHSCISYRVAQIKNVPQVALESGNSPQMIDSNYRELVLEPDALRWFAIMPDKATNKPASPKRKKAAPPAPPAPTLEP